VTDPAPPAMLIDPAAVTALRQSHRGELLRAVLPTAARR